MLNQIGRLAVRPMDRAKDTEMGTPSTSRTRSTTELIQHATKSELFPADDHNAESTRSCGPQAYPGASARDQIDVPPVFEARIFEGIEQTLRVIFLSSWILILPMAMLRVLPSASDAFPAEAERVVWGYIVALCSFQAFLYLLCVPLASFDTPHAINAFGHPYVIFGPTNYSKPNLSGLTHARAVRVPTPDGETLGGWHVLPGGATAREAAARVAAGEAVDDVYDESMQLAAGLGGARAVLYLHGMGESRCKWVVVEHLKFSASLVASPPETPRCPPRPQAANAVAPFTPRRALHTSPRPHLLSPPLSPSPLTLLSHPPLALPSQSPPCSAYTCSPSTTAASQTRPDRPPRPGCAPTPPPPCNGCASTAGCDQTRSCVGHTPSALASPSASPTPSRRASSRCVPSCSSLLISR